MTLATQVFLLVFLWIGGEWVPGWMVDGFYPRAQASLTQCLTNAAYLDQQPRQKVFLENGDLAVADKFQGRCMVVYPPRGL